MKKTTKEMTNVTLQNEVVMEMTGKKRHKNAKPVLCITEGKTFVSTMDAAEYYGVHNSAISAVCRGVYETCKGMKFCYVDKAKENLNVIAEEIQTKAKHGGARKARRVKCVETGVEYYSTGQCAKEIGVPQATLYYHLRGKKTSINGKHYVFVDQECAECVREMDPIIEKANAWDNLMAKKNRISDLRNEIKDGEIRRDEINAKLHNLTMEIEGLTNELEFIDHGYQAKANEIYELTHEIEKEMGLTL